MTPLPRTNGAGVADYEILVVGAGFSGLGAGIKLKEAGFEDFAILEQAADLGGTWRDNTYPGVAVDITSFNYSFSFAPNPGWSRVFARGREIKEYADGCADAYGLRERMRFNTTVTKATFDEAAQVWRVETTGGRLTTRYLITACGVMTQPKKPHIEGLDDFEGKVMHTARWDHGYDLRGKRVAVIGTGASAVQVVPAIADAVGTLHVFQRTPAWVLPRPDREIPPWMTSLFHAVPATQARRASGHERAHGARHGHGGDLSPPGAGTGSPHRGDLPEAPRAPGARREATREAHAAASVRLQAALRLQRLLSGADPEERGARHRAHRAHHAHRDSDRGRRDAGDRRARPRDRLQGVRGRQRSAVRGVRAGRARAGPVLDREPLPGLRGRDGPRVPEPLHGPRALQRHEGVVVHDGGGADDPRDPVPLRGAPTAREDDRDPPGAARRVLPRRAAAAEEQRLSMATTARRPTAPTSTATATCRSCARRSGLEVWWRSRHFDLDHYRFT